MNSFYGRAFRRAAFQQLCPSGHIKDDNLLEEPFVVCICWRFLHYVFEELLNLGTVSKAARQDAGDKRF